MSSDEIICGLAVEYWRLAKSFSRQSEKLAIEQQHRATSQVRYALKKLDSLLDDAGMSVAVFDGQAFEAGLPAIPLNSDDFSEAGALTVVETVSPAILKQGQVLIMAQVMLGVGGE